MGWITDGQADVTLAIKCTFMYMYIYVLHYIKLQAEPINTCILMMQVYMPTSEHEDDEMEELCDVIEEILEEDGKGDINIIITEDWNSIVGDESYRNIVGPHGLGRMNH